MLIYLSILLSPILLHEELLSHKGVEDWGVHEVLHNKVQNCKEAPEHLLIVLMNKVENIKYIADHKKYTQANFNEFINWSRISENISARKEDQKHYKEIQTILYQNHQSPCIGKESLIIIWCKVISFEKGKHQKSLNNNLEPVNIILYNS